ncbi:hypothetical protein [Ileibacterium valens]|uniref:Uncharacterized protein n=1 Tax=Ileibacterium valens TaxID=1862668 RepID=A0A1U7NDE2_9FIRM|nr:hypothetical protein [Ileibacterium valens]OLU37016.1 hypothetical protein BO222_11215 [Ileibacterium valens]OLU37018.1 hypothetical protein BO224_11485 [Erysipelotrichaceae bacterium NYU-BL-E8]OLU37071.1 hypothetical protein BM735_11360 [Erysipelotrichaceae bacterium NYU-BL-F16]
MTFTALTGVLSHFAIGEMPETLPLVICILSTLIWAWIAARFANKASAIRLNRVLGAVQVILGAAILSVNFLPL